VPDAIGWRPTRADLETIAEQVRVKLGPDARTHLESMARHVAEIAVPAEAAGLLYRECLRTRPAEDASAFLALEIARVLLLLNGGRAARIDRERAEQLLADVESHRLTDPAEIGRRLKDL